MCPKPPPGEQTDLSLPVHEIEVEHHVKIPMRDGTLLDATVWHPELPGKYPVLIQRDAYDILERSRPYADYYARRGYVFVGQNVRGSYASGGTYGWFRDDGWGANRDGYDTIEWAAQQSWSSGKVGMLGSSYSGMTQYLAAPARPPHLHALFVLHATSYLYTLAYRGGAHQMRWIQTVMMHHLNDLMHPETDSSVDDATRSRLAQAVEEIEFWHRHLPLKSCPPLEGLPYGRPMYFEALDHPEDDPYWWPLNMAHKYTEIDVPIVHLAGWFDTNLRKMVQDFQAIRRHGLTAQCRSAQRLLIGPWTHGSIEQQAGGVDFGPQAQLDIDSMRLRWYDYWLKGIDNGVMEEPPVRLFLMGENRWLDLDNWPPDDVAYTPIYLREGGGRSQASLNEGGLTFEPPSATEHPDSFAYDPHDAVPSLAVYPALGPHDYQALEHRLLTYTSATLEQDLVLIGPVKAVLFSLSTAPDTDWVVRLCDVHPDGRSMSVCDGILRARYRDSLQNPRLMTPECIYRFEIDLWATAHSFKASHRLRVHITSSDFPRYDRNLNTGGPFGEEARGQVAINTVFNDSERPSHIVLPVYVNYLDD